MDNPISLKSLVTSARQAIHSKCVVVKADGTLFRESAADEIILSAIKWAINDLNLWILMGRYNNEGDDILAVLTSKEEADALLESGQLNSHSRWGYDHLFIQKWNIGEKSKHIQDETVKPSTAYSVGSYVLIHNHTTGFIPAANHVENGFKVARVSFSNDNGFVAARVMNSTESVECANPCWQIISREEALNLLSGDSNTPDPRHNVG